MKRTRKTLWTRWIAAQFLGGVNLAIIAVLFFLIEDLPAIAIWTVAILAVIGGACAIHRTLYSTGCGRVPVVLYHGFGPTPAGHPLETLRCPESLFRKQLEYLETAGFQTVTARELAEHLRGERRVPPRSIALTFDDGYLDNWTVAHPLLEAAGMRATLFASTDFIDPRPGIRPQKAADKNAGSEADASLYLNSEELLAMDRSGVVEVESHAGSHTWYFTGPEIVDFHHPGDHYPWLEWNERPDQKPFWLDPGKRSETVPWGTPVHRYAKSLAARRYHPDPELAPYMTAEVHRLGGAEFFNRSNWRGEAQMIAEEFLSRNPNRGRYETDEELRIRLTEELRGSRSVLEKILGREVRILSWPGGGSMKESMDIAFGEAGYLAATGKGGWNLPGVEPRLISRISSSRHFLNLSSEKLDLLGFRLNVNLARGNFYLYPLILLAGMLSRAIPQKYGAAIPEAPMD